MQMENYDLFLFITNMLLFAVPEQLLQQLWDRAGKWLRHVYILCVLEGHAWLASDVDGWFTVGCDGNISYVLLIR